MAAYLMQFVKQRKENYALLVDGHLGFFAIQTNCFEQWPIAYRE